MVATRHCCYGLCRSDSRYGYRESMKGVYFIPFPKPHLGMEKSLRWVRACRRENFTVSNITKDTYICSLHFIGGKGPTAEHPDPIPATATSTQVQQMKKRKAPTDRQAAPPRKRKTVVEDGIDNEMADTLLDLAQNEIVFSDTSASCDVRWQHSVPTNSIGIQSIPEMNDASTQTDRSQDADIVALKIENLCLKNELMDLKSKKNNSSKKKHFSVEDVSDDDVKCKFYTGLTWLQLLCLWDFLGRATNKLSLWSRPMKHNEESPSKRPGPKRKLEPMNELFLTLVRLRLGLLHSDLAYRFGISKGKVSSTVITWVQCMFLQFSTLKDSMFPSRDILKKSLPKCFKKYKNVRSIIDCTEIFVQTATNFQQQGNLYSTYKSHPTFKALVGIAPNGAVTYLSDLFEGAASDRNIVIESGFLDKLEPGDLILADRGFTIRDVLFDKKADLNIPPFLHGRDRFTVQEEAETKQIAKVRIHVERAIERLKKYRLFQRTIPLSLAPVVSQMFFVVGCLVNFQEPLVS